MSRPDGATLTEADEAREIIMKHGVDFIDKNKNSLLHSSINKPPAFIYVFANNGVSVNIQNQNGDSALHLAVRRGRLDTATALLRCGADMTLKNKMGETPVGESKDKMVKLLKLFQPGLVTAVTQRDVASVHRLLKVLWCGVSTVVKDNKNIAELAYDVSDGGAQARLCIRAIAEHQRACELVHAVLAEDVPLVSDIIASDRASSINTRYFDKYGASLLSHAVEANNSRLVHVLVNSGAQVNGVRLRRRFMSRHTSPLLHSAMRADCPIDIAMFLHSQQSPSEHHEKDYNGNTPLLTAVSRDLPTDWLMWLLTLHSGYNLTDRNEDGLTARDMAVRHGNTEAVQAIDNFVCDLVGHLFLYHLPVSFYGLNNLDIVDQNGKSLVERVEASGGVDDTKVLRFYTDIERRGVLLFEAAKRGDVERVTSLNNACYRDVNGYTALTHAIVHDQLEVARSLTTQRPMLKMLPDNSNRYALHYAYALPDHVGGKFVSLLLETRAGDVEKRCDKDGLIPIQYKRLRDGDGVKEMLSDVITLSPYMKEKCDEEIAAV